MKSAKELKYEQKQWFSDVAHIENSYLFKKIY